VADLLFNGTQNMSVVNNHFKMLVLGDSMLWGQGLYNHQKIHTLVVAELKRLGLEVDCSFLAHSGAVIGEPDKPSELPPLEGPFANEVPVGEPTVFDQIRTALGTNERDESINLVILNGGVNDVDTLRIVNPTNIHLDAQIKDAFYTKTKMLIEKVFNCFPNAVIIVTGYYLFFSDVSEQSVVGNALKGMGLNVPLIPHQVSEFMVDALGTVFTDALIDRCTRFRDYSHDCIREAIIELTSIIPEVQARVFLADPKFKDENAVGAPESFLFGINADLSPQDPTEIAEGRREACERHADRLSLIRQFAGPRASVGHPNPVGAQQYADVILANIRYAMPTLFATE
jgi:hypothetical protein